MLIAVTVLRQRARNAAVDKDPAETTLSLGKYVAAPDGYRWEDHNRTLLFALRYGCIHCERNMELYREIQTKLRKSSSEVQLLSIFPDDTFVAQHDIDIHGLHGMPILANVNFDKLHLSGTPTLLLVDNHGAILHSWVGELSKEQQASLMQFVQ
jgi:hypothetical protein